MDRITGTRVRRTWRRSRTFIKLPCSGRKWHLAFWKSIPSCLQVSSTNRCPTEDSSSACTTHTNCHLLVCYTEMYGLIWATVQLKLPFTLVKSLVVSWTTVKEREGWAYIDALPESELCVNTTSKAMPVGLHYCKRYMLGNVRCILISLEMPENRLILTYACPIDAVVL